MNVKFSVKFQISSKSVFFFFNLFFFIDNTYPVLSPDSLPPHLRLA